MSGRWFWCPVDAWHDKREKPWSEACAVAELRWWEDQVRRKKEPKMPSRRTLEDLFGWSAHRVDKLRMSSHWLPKSEMVNPYLASAKNRPTVCILAQEIVHAAYSLISPCRSKPLLRPNRS